MLKVERAVRAHLLRGVEETCAAQGRQPWFVQVGANDGMTDDPMHRLVRERGWRGALLEPNPAAFAKLQANYAGIEALRFLNCAASDRDGEADFFVPANDRIATLDAGRGARAGVGAPIRVRTAPLATLIEEAALPHLDALVIDAEGHDGRILMPLDLARHRPLLVIFESHHLEPAEQLALRRKFEAAGYAVMRMHADSFAVQSRLVNGRLARLLEQAHEVAATAAREARQLARQLEQAQARAAAAPPPATPASRSGKSARPGDSLPAAPRPPARAQPDGPTEAATNKLRDWYVCVNERGLQRALPLLQVAVLSARRHTTLRPHCIYDGADCAELDWLAAQGVAILRHSPSLEPELRIGYGEAYDQFRGHWLRLDLPELAGDAEQVLYTDIDVMFLRDPRRFAFSPRYMAVCEEAVLGDRGHFNSGVMVMNLPALRAVRPWLVAAVRDRIATGFRYPAHDQKSLNDFFLPEADWMAPEFNWKPYWGSHPEAVVVHFHGPKPANVARLREGRGEQLKPALKLLYERNPQAYDAYVAAFDSFLREAPPLPRR